MTIIGALNYINKSIKSSFTNAVEKLTSHTFKIYFPKVQKVDVKFPEVQKIDGRVDVKFPDIQKIDGVVRTDTKPSFDATIRKLDEIKKEFVKNGITVNNFPEIPKKIEVTNFPEESELDLSTLEKKLDDLLSSIKKLPTKFPDFPKFPDYPKQKSITIPNSFVIDNLETLKSDNPKDYLPVRLTDGEEFYRAIDEFVSSTVRLNSFADVNGGKATALVDADRHVQVDVLTMPEINIPAPVGGATEAKQLPNNHQVTVSETNPLDTSKVNSSLTITEAVLGTVTTQTLKKTIGADVYQKTVASDSSDNSLSVSAWAKI